MDNPDLIAACVVGDGEAETGPLATAWHSNKFLNPITDGAVLPILHLNGYKMSNPTIFSRITHEEVEDFFKGCGWDAPLCGGGRARRRCTRRWPPPWTGRCGRFSASRQDAREIGETARPRWPMIVFRSPKGWTGPKEVDGAAGRGHLPRPPGPRWRWTPPIRSTWQVLEQLAAQLPAGGAL